MLRTLAVANYRSLRNLIVPLRRLNLITGPNGSGKSSVYRALRLLANAAERSQALVVTHAAKLIEALEEQDDCNSVRLEKEFGETKIVGADALDLPIWRWASR